MGREAVFRRPRSGSSPAFADLGAPRLSLCPRAACPEVTEADVHCDSRVAPLTDLKVDLKWARSTRAACRTRAIFGHARHIGHLFLVPHHAARLPILILCDHPGARLTAATWRRTERSEASEDRGVESGGGGSRRQPLSCAGKRRERASRNAMPELKLGLREARRRAEAASADGSDAPLGECQHRCTSLQLSAD